MIIMNTSKKLIKEGDMMNDTKLELLQNYEKNLKLLQIKNG